MSWRAYVPSLPFGFAVWGLGAVLLFVNACQTLSEDIADGFAEAFHGAFFGELALAMAAMPSQNRSGPNRITAEIERPGRYGIVTVLDIDLKLEVTRAARPVPVETAPADFVRPVDWGTVHAAFRADEAGTYEVRAEGPRVFFWVSRSCPPDDPDLQARLAELMPPPEPRPDPPPRRDLGALGLGLFGLGAVAILAAVLLRNG